MKREEVKNKIPGITDEQLDWLMGENGRDVTAEKTKAASLQGQVDDLTTQLNTAKDGLKAFEGVDVADLKGQITKLQGQLTDQADSFAFDAALDHPRNQQENHHRVHCWPPELVPPRDGVAGSRPPAGSGRQRQVHRRKRRAGPQGLRHQGLQAADPVHQAHRGLIRRAPHGIRHCGGS